MLEFSEILKANLTTGDKIENNGLKLNNPVLFVFLGETEKALQDGLVEFYEQKLQDMTALAFLNLGSSTNLADSLASIQMDFLKQEYTFPNYRRIYLIFNAHDSCISFLEDTIRQINTFFREFNNTPLFDIFSIMNETLVTNFENRKKIAHALYVLKELSIGIDGRKIINMVYLLSNLSSKNVICDFSKLYEAISLATLIKDGASCESNFKSYDERTFISRCNDTIGGEEIEQGYFYTIGTKKIEKPVDLIMSIVLKQVLTEDNKLDLESLPSYIKNFPFSGELLLQEVDLLFGNSGIEDYDQVYSLMLDTRGLEQPYRTNGEALFMFFGNLVQTYHEMNFDIKVSNKIIKLVEQAKNALENSIRNCIDDPKIGFYNARKVLLVLNETVFASLRKEIERKKNESLLQLNNWKDEDFNVKKQNKLMGKLSDYPFELAKDYLSIRNQWERMKALMTIFEKSEEILKQYIEAIERIYRELMSVQEQLKNFFTNGIKKQTTLTGENLDFYYEELTNAYLRSTEAHFFDRLYSKFFELGQKDLEQLYEECLSYVKVILNSETFNQNIYKEIYERIPYGGHSEFTTKASVTQLLYTEMLANKVYALSLTATELLSEDICFITNQKSLFDEPQMNYVNAFLDNQDNGLAIVYFIGAFKEMNLTNFNLYDSNEKRDMD